MLPTMPTVTISEIELAQTGATEDQAHAFGFQGSELV